MACEYCGDVWWINRELAHAVGPWVNGSACIGYSGTDRADAVLHLSVLGDDVGESDTHINYCPMCGRSLASEVGR